VGDDYVRELTKGKEPREIAMVIWAAGFKTMFDTFAALEISDDLCAETFLEFVNSKLDDITLARIKKGRN
jgi:hypothetical protein